MCIPCKNFKLPNKNPKQYFINHYKKCDNCEVVNNNNRELSSIIDHANVEIFTSKSVNDEKFSGPLVDYLQIKKHTPLDYKGNKFIRITRINNNHLCYDKCFIISWIDVSEYN